MKKEIGDSPRRIGLYDIVLVVVLLVIGVAFFFLLGSITGEGFGFVEILMSLAFALIVGGFLIWTKTMMFGNPYLGASIAVLGVFALAYGYNIRFSGKYSITFLVITSLIVLAYIGFNFRKYKGKEKQIPDEFGDNG